MARVGLVLPLGKAALITKELVQKLSTCNREPCLMADLVIGLECGGSDFTSGLASNPPWVK